MKKSRPPIQREKSSSYDRSIFVCPGLQSALPPIDFRGLSEISFFLESRDQPHPPPEATRPSWICCTFSLAQNIYQYFNHTIALRTVKVDRVDFFIHSGLFLPVVGRSEIS